MRDSTVMGTKSGTLGMIKKCLLLFSDPVIPAFVGGTAVEDLATHGGHFLWCKQTGVIVPASVLSATSPV